MVLSKYFDKCSFQKFFFNDYYAIFGVILRCDFLLPLLYVFSYVACIFYCPYVPVLSL